MSFKRKKNNNTLSYTMTDIILQLQLMSARADFPQVMTDVILQ